MSGELMNYVTGTSRVARYDRPVARSAKRVYDEVRLTALKMDGAIAVAGHASKGIVELGMHQRMLMGNDPVTNARLAGIGDQAYVTVRNLQANLYNNDWGL